MEQNEAQLKPYAEELEILYNLKSIVRRYRENDSTLKNASVFSGYAAAAGIAAAVEHKQRSQIFDELMRPLKAEIIKNLSSSLFQQPLTFPQELAGIADAAKLKSLNDTIAKIQKLKSRLDNRPQAGKEDSPVVMQLKDEIKAGITRSKKLTEAEKQQQIKLLEQASEIKVRRDGIKCHIMVDGFKEPIQTIIAVTGTELNGALSRYGMLRRETVKELSLIKRSKSFATGIAASAKQQKACQQNTENLKEEALKLKEEAHSAAQNLVYGLNSEMLYDALRYNGKGKLLLKTLTPGKTAPALQDSLRGQLLDAVVWDKNIWSLYQEEGGRSYYKDLADKIRPSTAVDKIVSKFMTRHNNTPETRKQAVADVAGTLLPYEVAQDMFVQGVFSYGMALNYADRFSDAKFMQMNGVLHHFGYHISLNKVKAQQECLQGAQKVSKAILNHMHLRGSKSAKNKTIALMYRLGEVLHNNPKGSLSPLDSKQIGDIYVCFGHLFYNAPENMSRADGKYHNQWNTFVSDKENRTNAVRLYIHLQEESRSSAQVARWIQNLAAGSYISEEGGVTKQDGHHITERKYGGIFIDNESLFNNCDNIASTISFHPVDADPHREAHKLDTRENYLYQHNGQYKNGAISGIRKGDDVYIPVLNVADRAGRFHPAIARDTLVITSRGLTIPEPNVPGRSRGNSLARFIENGMIQSTAVKTGVLAK